MLASRQTQYNMVEPVNLWKLTVFAHAIKTVLSLENIHMKVIKPSFMQLSNI